jgi:hypothetical protein
LRELLGVCGIDDEGSDPIFHVDVVAHRGWMSPARDAASAPMVAGAGPVSARKPGDAVPAESLGVSGVVLGHWLPVAAVGRSPIVQCVIGSVTGMGAGT